MPEASELEIASNAVDAAIAAGATQADATVVVADRLNVEARGSDLSKLERSRARSLGLRVFIGEPGALRRASLSTSDLDPQNVRALVERAVAAARIVAPDPYAGLPQDVVKDEDDAMLLIEDPDVGRRDPQAAVDEAIAMEEALRAYDPRIDNSSGSTVSETAASVALASSIGSRAAYRSTAIARGSSPVARDGENKRTAGYGSAARGFAGVDDALTVAGEAARRVIRSCGAIKPPTMRLPVIFERDVAGAILADLFSALSAANVAIGNSFFADRIGTRVGSDAVTVVDDGRLPGGLGTAPFDGEGVPTQRTPLIVAGTLHSFLFDTTYARRLGAKSTGNAAGGGIGPTNFTLAAGPMTLDALIASTPRAILITETIGFATEYASGTYSRGATGILVENGELTQPVDGFTVAGSYLEMLSAVDAVANDLRFDGTIAAPSFRVAEMTISGG